MDASTVANKNGNGHADPEPVVLPSAAAAPSGAPVPGAIPAPVAGTLEDARDPVTGKIRPGKSLNPKGRPPGIVNRNVQLNRGFEAFRASPELVRVALSKYRIRIRGLKAEALLITLAFARAIVDKDDSLLRWCGEHAYLTMTPAAAGIVINNNPQASAGAHSSHDSHVNVAKLLADAGGRDTLAQFAERLAACGAYSGESRHVRQ
jgi:hypothetical protein